MASWYLPDSKSWTDVLYFLFIWFSFYFRKVTLWKIKNNTNNNRMKNPEIMPKTRTRDSISIHPSIHPSIHSSVLNLSIWLPIQLVYPILYFMLFSHFSLLVLQLASNTQHVTLNTLTLPIPLKLQLSSKYVRIIIQIRLTIHTQQTLMPHWRRQRRRWWWWPRKGKGGRRFANQGTYNKVSNQPTN